MMRVSMREMCNSDLPMYFWNNVQVDIYNQVYFNYSGDFVVLE